MNPDEEQGAVPEFTFFDDSGRPIISQGQFRPNFRPNDEVLVYNPKTGEWTGPFLVSYVEHGRYKLCNKQQEEVNNGHWVAEKDLKLFDPFE